jgi:hypothetical protein
MIGGGVGMLGMAEGCWGVYFLYPEPVTRFNVEVKFSGWTFDSLYLRDPGKDSRSFRAVVRMSTQSNLM